MIFLHTSINWPLAKETIPASVWGSDTRSVCLRLRWTVRRVAAFSCKSLIVCPVSEVKVLARDWHPVLASQLGC